MGRRTYLRVLGLFTIVSAAAGDPIHLPELGYGWDALEPHISEEVSRGWSSVAPP